jgi:succinoglycan biosynthesis transport protein ExoP
MDGAAAARIDETISDASSSPFTAANLWRLTRKHGLLVVACFLTVFAGALFWSMSQPKIYRSEALLRIDTNPPKPLGQKIELVSDSTSWWNRREFLESEYRVMRSTRVATAIVRELGLQADPAFLGVPKVDRARFKPIPVEDAAAVLISRVSVEPVKDSALTYVRYEDTDPARAERVLQTLVKVYLEQNLEATTQLSTNALEWLNGQLATLREDLEKSEQALNDFRQKNNVLSISLEDRHNLISAQLEAITKEITSLEIRRVDLAAKQAEIGKATASTDPMAAEAPELLNNVVLTGFRQQYATQQRELAEMSETLGDNHPKVLAAREKLTKIQKQIQLEISNIQRANASELRAVDRRIADLSKRDESVQKQAHELQSFEVPYNQLTRTKTNNEKIYGLVLERARETGLTRMMNFNNIRAVEDPTLPKGPYKPNTSMNLLIGSAAGLLLGLGLAALREFVDSSMRTPADVETRLGATCLGLLPLIEDEEKRNAATARPNAHLKDRDLYVARAPESGIAEATRVIRTNLAFMSPDRPYKTVLMSSAVPAEGKTTVACSLAIALAQSGLRVLLVDTDLRRPRLHRTFALPNDLGLTMCVTGQLPIEECIRESGVDNLSVLTSGPLAPNPSELMHSHKFAALVEELKARYDRIVFDSPPVLPVTDAAILSQLVDGTIMVFRGFSTPLGAARQALRRLRDVKGHIIGVVLNAIDSSSADYRTSYYYTYGQYYGRREGKDAERAAS